MRIRARSRVGRIADLALAMAILSVLTLLVARVVLEPPETLSGQGRVVDGDTIMIGVERVRLAGIDAPELDQTCVRQGGDYACGVAARAALERLTGGGVVTCRGKGRDRYGRFLGYCEAAGIDLNRTMVMEGWAIAYGDYDGAEREARRGARGIWAGDFERPQEWRRLHGGLPEDEHVGVFARLFGVKLWHLFD